ncbi:FR47-like protein [Oscillospiraceae bacterium]|nr:FR47-like protein [Oscillospiraceae bacterium]
MNYKEMMKIAMRQSAEDLGCNADDFVRSENVVVPFRLGENCRKYLKLPITANLVSYGNNVVAGVTDDVADIVREYIGKFEYYHLFETPNMNWLSDRLLPRGHKCCFMAEYFLPSPEGIPDISCKYETRILTQEDFADLYVPSWSNALCENRKELDVLGAGAYDGDRLVGLAACSADCDTMWQIGVDVLPEYRKQGLASSLTSILAKEIIKRGKVPFYCCAWSNIRSARNAVRSGFVPSWVEFTVKPTDIVDGMNR